MEATHETILEDPTKNDIEMDDNNENIIKTENNNENSNDVSIENLEFTPKSKKI